MAKLYGDARRFDELLERLWILDTDDWMHLLGGKPTGLRAEIQQHVHRNPEDWPAKRCLTSWALMTLLTDALHCFWRGWLPPTFDPTRAAQRHFVGCVNESLHQLRRRTARDGFRKAATRSSLWSRCTQRLKADRRISSSPRPTSPICVSATRWTTTSRSSLTRTRCSSDRPIANDGLRWNDLQQWWSDTEQIADATQAKRSLLHASEGQLARAIPATVRAVRCLLRGFRSAVPNLPALLPEVWLHWDPRTVKADPDALLRSWTSFQLPQGVQVVIEVDGKHHYRRLRRHCRRAALRADGRMPTANSEARRL